MFFGQNWVFLVGGGGNMQAKRLVYISILVKILQTGTSYVEIHKVRTFSQNNRRSTESYLREPKVASFSSMPCQDRTPFFRRLYDLPLQNCFWANLSHIGGGGGKIVTSFWASGLSIQWIFRNCFTLVFTNYGALLPNCSAISWTCKYNLFYN